MHKSITSIPENSVSPEFTYPVVAQDSPTYVVGFQSVMLQSSVAMSVVPWSDKAPSNLLAKLTSESRVLNVVGNGRGCQQPSEESENVQHVVMAS